MNDTKHIPVLLQEVIEAMQPHSGGLYIDGTLGGGGHAAGILAASGPDGRLLGMDADAEAIARSDERLTAFADRATLVQANFAEIGTQARRHGFTEVDGIILDLGISSDQLDEPDRGFSFQAEGRLDMRLNTQTGISAYEVVNSYEQEELADILFHYGEERQSRRIARAIIANRPISTTTQLAQIIEEAVGGRRGAKLHPATRTFQAIRIYVNDELRSLEDALPQAVDLLRSGGVLTVISFHSLEDRIVKQFMRRESSDCICPPRTPVCQCGHKASLTELYRKGVTPTPAEIEQNPRSRSARLRAARKISSSPSPISV
ncbi:MAG: 16S rRNA (cytosine(1402)-N(4))-methyltransferase RsmH [Caldilineales bacterium]|nr:16S rRNA (cytosine(1402)-N(4))-methyltransferase RsmH [Caldilineales bacterium]